MESPSPVFAPPLPYVSLAATLLVHPSLTTFDPTRDDLIASNMSLRFLRTTLLLLGPMNACLNTAFVFNSSNNIRRSRANRLLQVEDASEPTEEAEALDLRLATTESVWTRAEDLWHAVGWSFTCETLYPHRWKRWKLWLDYILSVLENDFDDRSRLALTTANPLTSPVIPESLIFQYLTSGMEGFGGLRRIFRALFSTGTTRNVTEFPAVFTKETQQPVLKETSTEQTSSSKPLKLEVDEFGDFPLTSSTTVPSPPSTMPTPPSTNAYSAYATHSLRIRLLTLLYNTTYHPAGPIRLRALSDIFTDTLLDVPLSTFILYTSTPPFLPTTLLRPILSTVSASPHAPPRDNERLTFKILERSYASYPARHAGAMENARVSLLLEACVASLRDCDEEVTDALRAAVEKGCAVRRDKGGLGKKRKMKEGEEEALDILLASQRRLMRMVGLDVDV